MMYSFDYLDNCPQGTAIARLLNIEKIETGELSTPFFNDETQEATQVIP